MQPEIRVTKLAELQGTGYFEFQVGGPYPHWQTTSLYMNLESYNFVGKFIQRHAPDFHYCGQGTFAAPTWDAIMMDLQSAEVRFGQAGSLEEVRDDLFFGPGLSAQYFEADFFAQRADLLRMLQEFRAWIAAQLQSEKYITIQGI